MSSSYAWTVIVLMTIVTYIPRSVPMLLLAHRGLPHWFTVWLTFVPTAIFGALVFPDIFLMDGRIALGLNNIALWTTVLISPLVLRTRSLGLAIVSGAAVFAILQKVLG